MPRQELDYSKKKLGLVSSVVFNTSYSQREETISGQLERYYHNAQKVNFYHYAGWAFHRAVIELIISDKYTKKNFKEAQMAFHIQSRAADREGLYNFHGVKGFLKMLYLATLANPSCAANMYAILRGFSPYNWALFLAIFLDELVIDLAQLGLPDGEEPGSLRMSLQFTMGAAMGLNRFVMSSICEPLNHREKDSWVFDLAALSALIPLMIITFSGVDDTFEEMASWILDLLCRVLNVSDGQWERPVQIIITTYLILNTSMAVGAAVNFSIKKFDQFKLDLNLVSQRYPEGCIAGCVKFIGNTVPSFVRSISNPAAVDEEAGQPLNVILNV